MLYVVLALLSEALPQFFIKKKKFLNEATNVFCFGNNLVSCIHSFSHTLLVFWSSLNYQKSFHALVLPTFIDGPSLLGMFYLCLISNASYLLVFCQMPRQEKVPRFKKTHLPLKYFRGQLV